MQVWTSMGKFFRSMGHDKVNVSLMERQGGEDKMVTERPRDRRLVNIVKTEES